MAAAASRRGWPCASTGILYGLTLYICCTFVFHSLFSLMSVTNVARGPVSKTMEVMINPQEQTFVNSAVGAIEPQKHTLARSTANEIEPPESCTGLDQLSVIAPYDKNQSALLFTDCMDDLEADQNKHTAAAAASNNNKTAYCGGEGSEYLIHVFWTGALTDAARLGILSMIHASGPCARLHIWVRTRRDKDQVQQALFFLKDGAASNKFQVARLDFADLCDRIVALFPDTQEVVDKARPNLMPLATNVNHAPTGFSDFVRVLVLTAYGGAYLDCDMLLLRPLVPLLGVNFAYKWSYTDDCNTAIMHWRRQSPTAKTILCNILERSGSGKNTGRLVSDSYPRKVCQQVVEDTNLQLKIFPSAFFDPLWIATDTYGCAKTAAVERYGVGDFGSFFTTPNVVLHGKDPFAAFFPGAYTFHWHNQWNAKFEPNSTAALFLQHIVESHSAANQRLGVL
jgi:Glycosyltransferase sugar-binding region containing DXD motif